MKNEDVETIFHFLSKVAIVVPLVLIFVALVIKIGGLRDTLFSPQKILVSRPTAAPLQNTLNTSSIVKPATGEAAFDLVGPWLCNYSFTEGTLSASIKNKNAIAHFVSKGKTDNFLLNGDCVYFWETGMYSGQKFCGVSSYLGVFDMLSQFKMVNVGTIFQYLPQMGLKNNIPVSEADLKNFADSCKKREMEGASFVIPTNVLFKNISK